MLNKYQIMYLETSGNKNNIVLRRKKRQYFDWYFDIQGC